MILKKDFWAQCTTYKQHTQTTNSHKQPKHIPKKSENSQNTNSRITKSTKIWLTIYKINKFEIWLVVDRMDKIDNK